MGTDSAKWETAWLVMKVTMRLSLVLLPILTLLSGVLAWTPEDHEIFDLVSALEAAEGPKTSFYSFMNVSSSATTSEIAKSYRRRSLELHPDRGGDPERFARLGTISAILRDDEKRKRYHHFYLNGVPRWRGTGYYYARYRPGLGSVLVFLSVLSMFIQYAVQHLTRFSEVQRIKRFQDRAKEVAWGSLTPPSATSAKKRVRVALGASENSQNAVTMTVEPNGRVCIVDEDGSVHALDYSAAVKPSLLNTWIPNLARAVYRKAFSKPASVLAVPSSTNLGDVDAVIPSTDGGIDGDHSEGSGAATPVNGAAGEDGSAVNRKQRRAEAKASAQSKKKK